MKVKIDYNTRDRVCRKTILNSIKLLSKEIKELRKIAKETKLMEFQHLDLKDARNWIYHLKAVYGFYSPDSSVLDKFES